jgi:nucleotide-binding universal stress UspA family protein
MKVVVAIDDSVYSKDMLHVVCRRHWPQDVQFKIVSVIEPIPSYGHNQDEFAIQIEKRRSAYIENLCSDARHYIEKHVPTSIVHFEVREGSPSNEIISAASQWEANKILIGAHGHAICPHNLLGSVSRKVAERALCTVEIVRTGLKQETHPIANREVARA